MPESIRILMIEDDEKVASVYLRTLRRLRPEISAEHCLTLGDGQKCLRREKFDLLLLDLILPDSQGISTLEKIRKEFPHLPIMVLTGIEDMMLMAEAIKLGAKFFLVKIHTPPQSLVQMIDSIREHHLLEVELRQAQKLEAIGRLAAGIAHELNTPTQFVGDHLSFLKEAVEDLGKVISAAREVVGKAKASGQFAEEIGRFEQVAEEADLEYLLEEMPRAVSQCQEGVGRIASIVRAMKEFGHPGSNQKKAVDVNRCLRNTLLVARNEYKYVAEVEAEYGDIPQIIGFEGELNQVFLNMLVNAAHAIGDVVGKSGEKGKITVRTRQEGGEVVVEISDTGCGIPEKIRDKIFEPFFTTKEVGKGTGQGLAIARSVVVDKHGGRIEFTSQVGKGTTFYIRLPVGAGGEESAAP